MWQLVSDMRQITCEIVISDKLQETCGTFLWQVHNVSSLDDEIDITTALISDVTIRKKIEM